MKKVFFLMTAFCLLIVWQTAAQETMTTQKKATDQGSVPPDQAKVFVQPGVAQPAGTVKLAPVKADNSTQKVDVQNVSTSNIAPVNANAAANVSDSKKQDVSDFPVYVNTGNLQKDTEVYQKAKDEWIVKNPEKYRAMQQLSNQPQK